MSRSKVQMSEEFKNFVVSLCEYFRKVVFAVEYATDIRWVKKLPDVDTSRTALADVVIDDVYLQMIVQVSEELYRDYEKYGPYKVANLICHEFCHVLTEPLANIAMKDMKPSEKAAILDVVERQTTRIANAIMLLVPPGIYKVEQAATEEAGDAERAGEQAEEGSHPKVSRRRRPKKAQREDGCVCLRNAESDGVEAKEGTQLAAASRAVRRWACR